MLVMRFVMVKRFKGSVADTHTKAGRGNEGTLINAQNWLTHRWVDDLRAVS